MQRFHNVSYRLKRGGSRTREAWVLPERTHRIAAELAQALEAELLFCRVSPTPGPLPDFDAAAG